MRTRWIPILFLGLAGPVGAVTIEVPADQPTIQAGIDAAQAGDTVRVACGTYREHDIAMKSGVWLRSRTGDPACVTVDAERLGRVFRCDDVDAAAGIEGLTITGAYLEGYWPTSRGGGIALHRSSPTIRACVFTGNEAQAGGGGCFAYASESIIEDCVFSNCAGVDGGGIYVDDAAPKIRDCTFYDNESLFWGGAIFCENHASTRITGCTIVRNSAYEGSGIWCVNECQVILENSLVAYNIRGVGIFAALDPGHDCTVTVACSDAFDNVGANYGGTLEDQTGISGNISSDPLICGLEELDLRLAGASPCLPQNNDCGVLMGAYGEGCLATAGIADGESNSTPARRIGTFPNPFRASTEIRFHLESAAPVALHAFDPAGRMVREILGGSVHPSGNHVVSWNGRDDGGRRLAGGVYLLRLRVGDQTLDRKVVLLGNGETR